MYETVHFLVVLHPVCDISEKESTFPEGAKILGYDDSSAELYAEQFSREFGSLGHKDFDPMQFGYEIDGDHVRITKYLGFLNEDRFISRFVKLEQ